MPDGNLSHTPGTTPLFIPHPSQQATRADVVMVTIWPNKRSAIIIAHMTRRINVSVTQMWSIERCILSQVYMQMLINVFSGISAVSVVRVWICPLFIVACCRSVCLPCLLACLPALLYVCSCLSAFLPVYLYAYLFFLSFFLSSFFLFFFFFKNLTWLHLFAFEFYHYLRIQRLTLIHHSVRYPSLESIWTSDLSIFDKI